MVKELSFIRRNVEFEPHSYYVLVGLRRAGKSYMLYQHIHDLLQQGHSIEEFLYFNFEDDRLANIQLSDLDLIKQAYEELFAHKPIFMLDEIQLVGGWEKFARRQYQSISFSGTMTNSLSFIKGWGITKSGSFTLKSSYINMSMSMMRS